MGSDQDIEAECAVGGQRNALTTSIKEQFGIASIGSCVAQYVLRGLGVTAGCKFTTGVSRFSIMCRGSILTARNGGILTTRSVAPASTDGRIRAAGDVISTRAYRGKGAAGSVGETPADGGSATAGSVGLTPADGGSAATCSVDIAPTDGGVNRTGIDLVLQASTDG